MDQFGKHGCFDTQDGTYRESQVVPVHVACYGYQYINKGDTGVLINGTYLNPRPAAGLSGESYGYVDAGGRITKKPFQIVFDAAPMTDPWVEIHQVHHI